ncbi:MAG: ribonuclease [Pseudomonadota bacterium]
MLRNGYRHWQEIVAAMRLALLAGLISLTVVSPTLVQARGPQTSTQIDTIALTQLPPQARDMMTLIYQGGPFRYDKDGTVFGNRERILPAKNRGYYREYTVRTPNERSRGARRIICGGVKPAAPDTCYYTDDHYASFRRIAN